MLYATGNCTTNCGSGTGLCSRDVSDPANPVLLTNLQLGSNGHALDVDAQNDRLHIHRTPATGNGFTDVSVLDVSDPAKPVELDAITHHGVEPSLFHTSTLGLSIIDVLGVEPECATGDLNDDGVVDVDDLFILLANWE